MGTAIRHPLIDGITNRVALVESRARVVRLSAPLADLLSRPVAQGRTLVLLTPESSRVTIGLRSALVAAGGIWAVVTPGGFRDGISGVDHRTLDEVVSTAGSQMGRTSGRADIEPTAVPAENVATQLSVDVTLVHRSSHDTLLGGALEVLGEAIGGCRPLACGTSEPLEKRWDRWVLTQDARHRAPESTRIVVEGDHLSAALTVRVTDRGIEETIALTVDVPDGVSGLDPAISRLGVALADLTRTSLPTFALVLARQGEIDRCFRPVVYPPPNPIALLIGAPSVRRLDLRREVFAPEQDVVVVGRPSSPAYLLPLGTANESGWGSLQDALDSVGTERLTTLVDAPLLEAWEEDLHGDLGHDGDPRPHDGSAGGDDHAA